MKINGRTFVISGGASGLGRACVEAVLSKGGYVAILDMNRNLGEKLAQEPGFANSKFFQVDVSQTESISKAMQSVNSWVQKTGKAIGGIITAAGIASVSKIIDRNMNPLSLDDFDTVMNINVRGTIDLICHVLPQILKTEPLDEDGERGVIIMVSSVAAFDGQQGQVAYAASKGAISSLTLPMMRDLSANGVRVVTIAPGLFDTGMTSLMSDRHRQSFEKIMEFPARPGRPYEFAQLAIHAIENIMLNGVVMRLDGGMRLSSKL